MKRAEKSTFINNNCNIEINIYFRGLFVSYKSNFRSYRIIFIFHRRWPLGMSREYFRTDRGQPTVLSCIERKREIRVFERSHVPPNRGNIALKCSSILPLVATRSSTSDALHFPGYTPAWCMHRRSRWRSRLFSHGDWIRRSKLHSASSRSRARARDLFPLRKPSSPLSSLSLSRTCTRSCSARYFVFTV